MRQLVVDKSSQPIRNLCRNPTFGNGLVDTSWTAVSASLYADAGRARVEAFTSTITTRAAPVALIGMQPPGTYTVSADIQFSSIKGVELRVRYYNYATNDSTSRTVSDPAPFVGPRRVIHTESVSHPFDRIYFEFTSLFENAYVTGDVAGWIDNVVINAGQPIPYYDGDSYNWHWIGTPHASESVGYALPASFIRNHFSSPSAELGGGWASNSGSLYPIASETDASFARRGSGCKVVTRMGAVGSALCSTYILANLLLTSWSVKPGETIFAAAYMRAELPGRQARVRLVFRDATGVSLGSGANVLGPLIPLNAGRYVRVGGTAIVPAGAASAVPVFDGSTIDGSDTVTGERVWFDDGMLVNGSETPYADGDTPGWHWEGIPHASTSVGYPRDSVKLIAPNAVMQLDASLLSGSGSVTNIPDLTGNGNSAIADASVTSPPSLMPAAINGRNAVRFDTAALQTSCVPATGSGPRTLLAVIRPTQLGSYSYSHLCHYGEGATRQAFGLCHRVAGIHNYGNHEWASSQDSGQVATAGETRIIVADYDGTTERFFTGSVIRASRAITLNTGSSPLRIGTRFDLGTAEPGRFDLAELIAWPRVLTQAEINELVDFLAFKWGCRND